MTAAAAPTSSNQQKYESDNPLQQQLIKRFQTRCVAHLSRLSFRTVIDVGCGEGFLSRVLLDAFPHIELTGVDLSEEAVRNAALRCPEGRFEARRVETLADAGEHYDLVVCSEVLEHLDDPQAALDTLQRLADHYALLTVPWEPWFLLANLARGKYLKTFGNHPEHIQHWTMRGFTRDASRVFEPLHTETRFPWTIFLGRTRTLR